MFPTQRKGEWAQRTGKGESQRRKRKKRGRKGSSHAKSSTQTGRKQQKKGEAISGTEAIGKSPKGK